eukprot:scaffold55233_cov36-Prasinocladus_malaysianus.AAC.1
MRAHQDSCDNIGNSLALVLPVATIRYLATIYEYSDNETPTTTPPSLVQILLVLVSVPGERGLLVLLYGSRAFGYLWTLPYRYLDECALRTRVQSSYE